jgi:hypothetical protein
MGRTFTALAWLAMSTSAFAGSITIRNEDDVRYTLLLNADTCFSGQHTSIDPGYTKTWPDVAFVCLNEMKPAVPVQSGKVYVIKNGGFQQES